MPKLIYCTSKDISEARMMAKTLLEEKLVACVNIMPSIESMYRWKGIIESEKETALFIKTVDELVEKTIKRINQIHSYDVPEIIALPLVDGLPEYFDFLRKETL
jgi:periplasmic divalent cation tolerance protein